MYKIISNKEIAPNIYEIKLCHPDIAKKVKPGQFVIVMPDKQSERIPLTVADWNSKEGSITLLVIVAGISTTKLTSKKSGEDIETLAGPLGKPSKLSNFGNVLLVGGCFGIGAIYPIAKELKKSGNNVAVAQEGRSKYLLYWKDKLQSVSDIFFLITRDGSDGYKGHVTTAIDIACKKMKRIDKVFVIGCPFMMMLASQHTKSLGIKTVVNLIPIMLDATGMCGACRVEVEGKTKFACVDGPEFDAHEVNWDLLIARRKAYLTEETNSLCTFELSKDI